MRSAWARGWTVAALAIAVADVSAHAADGASLRPAACPVLQWTTLGTAGGPVATPDRSEPANLLVAGDRAILVDSGDGAVNQLARARVDLGAVETVFVSHHHVDHTGGLAAVIGLRWMNEYPGVTTIYGPPGTSEIVEGIVASLAPAARMTSGPGRSGRLPADTVKVIELKDGDKARVGPVEVTAVANSHFSHSGPVQPGEPVSLSYRFDFGDRSITYTGDTGPSDAVTELAKGSDVLVSEVIDFEALISQLLQARPNMSPEQLARVRSHLAAHHLSAADVGRMAAKAHVKRVVMTHFSLPPVPVAAFAPSLTRGARTQYDGMIDIAQDLSSYEVGCR